MDEELLAFVPEESRERFEEKLAAALAAVKKSSLEEAAKRDEGRTHAQEGQPRSSAAPSSKPPSQEYAQGQQQGWAPSPLPGKMMGPTRIPFVSGKESGGSYDQLAEMEECWTTIRWKEAWAAKGKVKAVREVKLTGFDFGTFSPEQWRTYADYERMACNEYQRVYDEITKTMNTVLAVQAKALRERREKELAEGRHLPPHNYHIASVDRRHETPDTSNSGLRQEPLQEVRVEPERMPPPPPQSPPPPPQPQQPQQQAATGKGDEKTEAVVVDREVMKTKTEEDVVGEAAMEGDQEEMRVDEQEELLQQQQQQQPPQQQRRQLPASPSQEAWPLPGGSGERCLEPGRQGAFGGGCGDVDMDDGIARLVPPSPAWWWGYKERDSDESHGEPDGSVSEREGIGTGWSCSSTFMGWGCEPAGRRRLAQLRRARVREK